MNNKKTITICSIGALIVLAIVILITIMSNLTGFSIILGTLFIILIICLGIYLKEEPDEYQIYLKNKNRILRTYDQIIIEVEDIPNIAGKNIIKVKSFEDLVDAQLELREPIYYKNDNDSCFFILLHYNEACVYILKMNEDVVSPTEQGIRYMKEDKENKKESILDNVENTIVYKLDELRSFKISPIRNKEAVSIKDDTGIKEEIDKAKEKELTTNNLEEEISKTQYIKDLKEKIKQIEDEEEKEQQEIANIKVVEDSSIEVSPEEISGKSKAKEEKAKPKVKKETKKKVVKRKPTHQDRRTSKHKTQKKNA